MDTAKSLRTCNNEEVLEFLKHVNISQEAIEFIKKKNANGETILALNELDNNFWDTNNEIKEELLSFVTQLKQDSEFAVEVPNYSNPFVESGSSSNSVRSSLKILFKHRPFNYLQFSTKKQQSSKYKTVDKDKEIIDLKPSHHKYTNVPDNNLLKKSTNRSYTNLADYENGLNNYPVNNVSLHKYDYINNTIQNNSDGGYCVSAEEPGYLQPRSNPASHTYIEITGVRQNSTMMPMPIITDTINTVEEKKVFSLTLCVHLMCYCLLTGAVVLLVLYMYFKKTI